MSTWLESILLWFVTPILIFLFLVKPVVVARSYTLLALAHLVARFLVWRNPKAESYIVCAFPPLISTRLRRGIWSENDTSFMFMAGCIKSAFLICEGIRNEEEKRWVVPALKRQIQNYLFLHHKPFLNRVFDWFGFTGAFRQGFGKFAMVAIRRTPKGLETESLIATPKRIIGASFSERKPTPVRNPNLSFDQKVDMAIAEVEKVRKEIEKRYGKPAPYNHPTLLLEEARIARSLATSEGESVRLLKAIGSRERSVAEFSEQLIVCISRVYK